MHQSRRHFLGDFPFFKGGGLVDARKMLESARRDAESEFKTLQVPFLVGTHQFGDASSWRNVHFASLPQQNKGPFCWDIVDFGLFSGGDVHSGIFLFGGHVQDA